ncbi:MAG TPA: EAL domain-containing protein [Acidimicrobiales bacterium]|nr:EAL domain-containing protein [Acidimicrobiales bacterium]
MSEVNGANPVRVLVADDDDSIRRTIARLLSRKASLELVGMAADADEAVKLGSLTHPDVALVDVRMPKGGGVHAARELQKCSPETKVVALSGHADRDGVLEMLSAGAVGYLVKGANVDVVQGILAASRGEGVISNEVAADVIGELGGHLARQREHEETQRLGMRRIERVIADRGFEMVFQPVLDLHTGKMAGVEALARFSSEPYRTPDLWFEEAWSLGLGEELELAAVHEALDSARPLPPDVFVAVNVSPRAATTSRLSELLASENRAASLVVELTEHAVVEDYGFLTSSLEPLRESGMRVAVDDAGAGYASLHHVLHVKPDFIKLDISLISGIDEDRDKLALAEGITSFARASGAKVVAEGIETTGELECVAGLGIDYAQGYLLGRPSPLEAVKALGVDFAQEYLMVSTSPAPSAVPPDGEPRDGSLHE